MILPGQEDEATPDPDGCMWIDEREDDEKGNPVENGADFHSDDWDCPDAARDLLQGPEGQEDEDEDKAPASEPTVSELALALPADAITFAWIAEARKALASLNNQVGANLRQVLDTTFHVAKKRFLSSPCTPSEVHARMLRVLENEEGSQAGE